LSVSQLPHDQRAVSRTPTAPQRLENVKRKERNAALGWAGLDCHGLPVRRHGPTVEALRVHPAQFAIGPDSSRRLKCAAQGRKRLAGSSSLQAGISHGPRRAETVPNALKGAETVHR
ncbi:hypothetical protein NHX12_022836, partial [Muraenolepis orangiensis]